MPQIFHRSFNVIARVSVLGGLLILAGVGWVGYRWVRSPYMTNAYSAVQQPVPFSHQHHVGDLKIDCRYCHTTVEKGPFAGMPTTKTCMNCHSQMWVGSEMLAPIRESYAKKTPIAWTRVHNLADFVYFDHSIHVRKGVGCASCHGRVDQMPLTWQVQSLHMEWCLECHRNPEDHVRPRDRVFDLTWQPEDQKTLGRKLVDEYGIRSKTSCSYCHR
jgi:hypothetical protein